MIRSHFNFVFFVLAALPVACVGATSSDEGENVEEMASAVIAELDVSSIAVGDNHACALLTDKTVRCWGDNDLGQLGNGTTLDVSSPSLSESKPMLSNVKQIALGGYHSCALLSSGSVKCWGNNNYGQLGLGSSKTAGYYSTPQTVSFSLSSGVTVSSIALGSRHSCALLSDGNVKCWGLGEEGEIGNGSTYNQNVPTSVSISSVAQLEVGGFHACARTTSNAVKCWGQNTKGQLGDGTTTNRTTPVTVSPLTAVEVAAGGEHSCARLSNGNAKCWGSNSYGSEITGQLGTNSSTLYSVNPITLSTLGGIADLELGSYHSCARKTDNTLKCWGKNYFGEVGDNTTTTRKTPVSVVVGDGNTSSYLSGVSQVALGEMHSCARLSNGTVKCWGRNDVYQVGDGSITQRNTPTTIITAVPADGSDCYTYTTGNCQYAPFNECQICEVCDGVTDCTSADSGNYPETYP